MIFFYKGRLPLLYLRKLAFLHFSHLRANILDNLTVWGALEHLRFQFVTEICINYNKFSDRNGIINLLSNFLLSVGLLRKLKWAITRKLIVFVWSEND